MQFASRRFVGLGFVPLILVATSHLLCAQQTGPKRNLFVADYQKKIAGLVTTDNALQWQLDIQDIHDVQSLPDGKWLLQRNFGEVIEIDSDAKVLWRYEAGKTATGSNVEIHAFRRLPNGLTMIAESGTSRILEVDRELKLVHSIPLQVLKPDAHRDTRLVRPTTKGTYVVAHEGEKVVREYDRSGKVVWEYSVGTQLYSATRLENGNTLIGAGDGHRVIEVSPQKEIVWSVSERELPKIQLAWVTLTERLNNGNTWIVNCHAGPDNPQIIEVTPDKQVVWSFRDFDRFGNALPVSLPIASK